MAAKNNSTLLTDTTLVASETNTIVTQTTGQGWPKG